MTLTDISYRGGGFTATFSDGSVAEAFIEYKNNQLQLTGINTKQQQALNDALSTANNNLDNDPRFRILITDPRSWPQSITSNTNLVNPSGIILINAANNDVDITLPSATDAYRYLIKRIDDSGNTVRVLAFSGQTIDGDPLKIITAQWVGLHLISNQTNWFLF